MARVSPHRFRRLFLVLAATAMVNGAKSARCAAAPVPAARPNILLILADDLGYGDPGCYNPASKIPTPYLDRLAAGGMRFTDAHTPSAVCTPTRYGLLTGRYCWRTALKRGVLDGFDPPLIETGRITLASFLKTQGYSTACIGKWHLGLGWQHADGTPLPSRLTAKIDGHRAGEDADFTRELRGGPLDCGFDSWFGISASLDMSPYGFIENRHLAKSPTEKLPASRDLTHSVSAGMLAPGFTLEGVLPEFTRRAEAFLHSRAGQKAPFFLYLPLNSPHLPVVPSAGWRGKTGAGDYADFVAQTDAAIGTWLAALQRSGQEHNTLVIVTSDNGGLWHEWTPKEADDRAAYRPTPRGQYNAAHGHHSNGPLRGTKADIWEGGHRVPFLVRWPAEVKPGVTDALVELNDIFATIAEITGQPLPAGTAEDSFSFLPVLTGRPATGPHRAFGVHHSLHGLFGLREGPWKYVPARGSGGFSTPKTRAGEPAAQLYRIDTDPAETQNLAAQEPEMLKRLEERLHAIQTTSQTRP